MFVVRNSRTGQFLSGSHGGRKRFSPDLQKARTFHRSCDANNSINGIREWAKDEATGRWVPGSNAHFEVCPASLTVAVPA